jgi:hypothetical protein
MDQTLLYCVMIGIAMLMGILPFGVFMGMGSALGVASSDSRLLVVFMLSTLVLSYVLSLGAFYLIQSSNCKSVKSMKQISANATLAMWIQSFMLFLVWFFPSLRGVVSGLLPPTLDPAILDSIGYGYYTFWASLFGTAIGGTLSAVCP